MTRILPWSCCLFLGLLFACGGDGGGGGPGPGPTTVSLISRSWTQAAMTESYQCREIQATADLLITAFQPTRPPGQFRLWVVTSDVPTHVTSGDFACDQSTILAGGNRLIYVAGMGTDDLQLPAGVGVHVRNGQYVTLVVQVVNVQPTALTGTSGVTVQTASAVTHEADMVVAGATAINIPASGSGSVTDGCTASTAWNLFALIPMGNALATHSTVKLAFGATTTLHDAAYDFNQQDFVATSGTVTAGTSISVTCDYTNPRTQAVHFGWTSSDEVCFAGLFRYPAPAVPDNPFSCVGF